MCNSLACDATRNDGSCCDKDHPCDLGEGDCDDDHDCMEGMTCGDDNCVGDGWDSSRDCCTKSTFKNVNCSSPSTSSPVFLS